jgi:hypothetical protein
MIDNNLFTGFIFCKILTIQLETFLKPALVL